MENHDADSYARFVADLARIGVPEPLNKWLYAWAIDQWHEPPVLDRTLTVESEDLYDSLVDGTIEVCKYRPTISDLNSASEGGKLRRFGDLASTLANLFRNGPDVGNDVVQITSENCSDHTRELWKTLSKLDRREYNDQFAIHCLLDKSLLAKVGRPNTTMEAVYRSLGITNWWIRFGTERKIKQLGGVFETSENLADCVAQAGDILKIMSQPPDAAEDRFVVFAIVGEIRGAGVKTVEFKFSQNSPLRATLAGMDAFFFRDNEVRLKGIWRLGQKSLE